MLKYISLLISNNLKKFSLLLQRKFILSLIIIIIICIVINTIIFNADQKDVDNAHFNRNYTTDIIDNKEIKRFISSPLTDATHFTITTFSTVGFGDITPKTSIAKLWTNCMQILVIIMTLKLFEYVSENNSSCQADFREFMLSRKTMDVWKKKSNIVPSDQDN